MSNIQNGFEFDWDSAIEKDGEEFVLLPEGKYNFEVTGFERQRYTPGANSRMPACPMALLKLRVSSELGTATVEERLYLHSSAEWKLCQFFTAIGQRSRGERLVPNWRAVLGAKGRCEVTVRQWTDRNGETRKNNQIKTFLEPEEASALAQSSAYGGGF